MKLGNIRKPLLPILGTIAVGVIGSAIWDFVAKPGLTTLSRVVLNTLTFGSQSVKDQAYANAALDPAPLPSLLLIIFLTVIPLLVALRMALTEYYQPYLRSIRMKRYAPLKARAQQDLSDEEKIKLAENLLALDNSMKRRRRHLANEVIAIGTVTWLFFVTGTMVLNQSILIKRTFEANLNICAPYLSDQQVKTFRAHFSAMSTKEDYLKIRADLMKFANKNKLTLHSREVW
jgi:hypothetical protein